MNVSPCVCLSIPWMATSPSLRLVPPVQLSDSASGGAVMWTAPVMFNISGCGLGLTLGFATVDSLILVEDEGAVDAYYKTQVRCSAAA